MQKPILVILRKEFRISDNPLFIYALSTGKSIVPVFINDLSLSFAPGAASKLWLRETLMNLKAKLQETGLDLITRQGNFLEETKKLLQETEADEIVISRSFEPEEIKLDEKLAKLAQTTVLNSFSLFDPDTVLNKSGGIFKVFTPFYKHCLTLVEDRLVSQFPKQLMDLKTFQKKLSARCDLKKIKSHDLDFKLNNYSKWHDKMLEHWDISSQGAWNELQRFIKAGIEDYATMRDFPAETYTSKLSSYLHFGQISAFRIWHEVTHAPFLRQLIWREFAIYILYHFPFSATSNLDKKFDKFPWIKNPKLLDKWQQGLTGYPIVDAGMRELWETGWMHNRVRMIVGSFLVKDLLIHWKAGADWFWDTLFDADLPNNTMGWQWVAGSGVDASPYFRIFNPMLQGKKFDPEGSYVKKWCPELSKLDAKWIHEPFAAPPLILEAAGIKLGKDYPLPVVNHNEARGRALEALSKTKNS